MYIPNDFKCSDQQKLYSFINQYNFSTVVSQSGGEPFATHLPLILDEENNQLIGHMEKANKHWKEFQSGKDVLCIFQGPHSYISPSWYEGSVNVPTWNYTAVHVYGAPQLITEIEPLDELLALSVEKFEADMDSDWVYDIPQAYKERLIENIVGFHIKISRIEGKFKMNQNRNTNDINNVIKSLRSISGDQFQDVAKWIEELRRDK